ncbi:MAG: hypothetical protein HY458_00570 [Parcubacteria group bacterium]|nr:hypothetical protein [Parcubacteria group bacterium]
MSIETPTIGVEEEDVEDLGFEGERVDEIDPVEFARVGEEKEQQGENGPEQNSSFQEEGADLEKPDTLEEIIARFGGDSKEWEKTHTEAPSMVFRDGKLWNAEKDTERSITEQIEEEATPEQIALHHSINETWSSNANEVQLVDYKEETEAGHILHVTALWLEQDNVVVSETWSREIKEEQEQFLGNEEAPVEPIAEPQEVAQIQQEETQEQQEGVAQPIFAEQSVEAHAEAREEDELGGDAKIEPPVSQEIQVSIDEEALDTVVVGLTEVEFNSVKLLQEISPENTFSGFESGVEVPTQATEESQQEKEIFQQEIPAALQNSPFWGPILSVRMEIPHTETATYQDPELETRAERTEIIETVEESPILNSVRETIEKERDLQDFFASLVEERPTIENPTSVPQEKLNVVKEISEEKDLEEFFASLTERDSLLEKGDSVEKEVLADEEVSVVEDEIHVEETRVEEVEEVGEAEILQERPVEVRTEAVESRGQKQEPVFAERFVEDRMERSQVETIAEISESGERVEFSLAKLNLVKEKEETGIELDLVKFQEEKRESGERRAGMERSLREVGRSRGGVQTQKKAVTEEEFEMGGITLVRLAA